MPSREKLSEFTAWSQNHITGDEKGQAQIFLARSFQALGQPVPKVPDALTDCRLI